MVTGMAKMTLGELLEQSGTLDDDYGNGYYNLDIRDECEEFTWIQGTSHSRLIWLLGDIPVESFEPADKNTLIVWVNSDYITEELKRRHGMAKYDPDEFFNRKKPTNADRIRAMSDEELAELLGYGDYPPWCVVHEECPDIKIDPPSCEKCALDWLKSPVEVDDGSSD